MAVDPARPFIAYAGGDGTIYKTTDGGDVWTLVNNGFPALPLSTPGTSEFAIDPRDTDTVYVGSTGIYKTTDGGNLWTRSDQGLPAGYVFAVSIDWSNPDYLLAGTEDGLFRSADRAGSWSPAALSGRSVLDIEQDPLNPLVLFAGTDAGAFRSDDNGGHWLPLPGLSSETAVHQIAIAPSDPATVYAATAMGVYRSRDGGLNWEPLGIDHRVTRVIVPGLRPLR